MDSEAGKVILGEDELEWSPPQTELDSNIRNVLSHITRHLRTISFKLEELPVDGYIMWDVAEIPNGDKVMTVWWTEGDGGNEDADGQQS